MKHLVVAIIILLQIPARGATIVVGANEPVNTLLKGIEMAKNGDTVLIKKGTYYINNIIVTKQITILGEDFPVLHGSDKYQIFTISGRNIRIEKIHFSYAGYSSMNDLAAIKIVDSRNIVVENNRLTHTYFGIHVANTADFIIRNNTLQGVKESEQTTGNGIHLWKCSNALIENNRASGHRDGIYFEFVTDSRIINNISENNIRYGLHFMFSNDDIYSGNTFRENGAGVAVMFSRKVTMNNNYFGKNWGPSSYGILLKEISDSKILGNQFIRNTVAIYMEGSNRIEVSRNIFKDNGWASKVQASCNDNTFHHNNFIANTFDISTNGSLVLNEFHSNYWDKYEGYDMNRDGVGDVPYRPVSVYSMLTEQNPNTLLLLRSFIVTLLEKAEKAIPSLTPENLKDDKPLMRSLKL